MRATSTLGVLASLVSVLSAPVNAQCGASPCPPGTNSPFVITPGPTLAIASEDQGNRLRFVVNEGHTYLFTTCEDDIGPQPDSGDGLNLTVLVLHDLSGNLLCSAAASPDCPSNGDNLYARMTWTATLTGFVDLTFYELWNPPCFAFFDVLQSVGHLDYDYGEFPMSDSPVLACDGVFTDTGGTTGAYGSNENFVKTITPDTPGTVLRATFTGAFNISSGAFLMGCSDELVIYDGDNTAIPPIGTYCSSTGSPGTVTSTAADGSLTFVFTSDGSFNMSGWEANLSCVAPVAPPNDDCASAAPIGIGEQQFGRLAWATGDGDASCGSGNPDVWYRYTAGSDGFLSLSTCGSNALSGIDTALSVHSTCPGTSANELACSDNGGVFCDPPSPIDSSLGLQMTAGQEVLIRVTKAGDGSTSTGDDFYLSVRFSGDFDFGCHGDGGDQLGCSDCPCSNNAPPGTFGGCLNSSGSAGILWPSGSTGIAAGDLEFDAFGIQLAGGAPTNAILSSGNVAAPNPAGSNPCALQNPGSGFPSFQLDGLRCIVQGVLRHGARFSNSSGQIGITNHGWGGPSAFFNFDQFMAGQTKHFQLLYRELASENCGTEQNSSQRVTLTFAP